jgi:acyl-CoA synthetase (AMP-forming)/AMP-acid ligase II
VKGPVVTKGYYGNPQATKDSFVDGWFCTGDIAVWKNGLPYIVDRKKVRIPLTHRQGSLLTKGNRNSSSTKAFKWRQLNLRLYYLLTQRC